jgi:hypothetical protein
MPILAVVPAMADPVASASIMPASVAMPAVRQNRSKLAPTFCQASSTISTDTSPARMVDFFVALLPFDASAPPSL